MEASEIERELEELETRVERLRALYEQYFMGIEKVEPQVQRKDVDRRVVLLRKEQIRNTGMRFKFQMLVQRYNTLQQYWGRITREIENGTYRRDVMRAAAKFGAKEMLTIVGKKRAAQFERLLAQQGDKAPPKRQATGFGVEEIEVFEEVDEMMMTNVDDEDEAPTPPRLGEAPPVAGAQQQAQPLQRSITSPGTPLPYSQPTPPPYSQPGNTPPPFAQPSTGLRFGSRPRTRTGELEAPSGVRAVQEELKQKLGLGDAEPASARDGRASSPEAAKRRVAELAAQMQQHAPRPEIASPPSFGRLDLDFDDGRRSSRPPPPEPARAPSIPPSFGQISLGADLKAPAPPPPSHPPPAHERERARPGATMPQGARPGRPLPPPETASSPLPRQTAPRKSERPAPKPAPAPPSQGSDVLPDQRIRQIYAKYVETKRAANESTAGVTFEKLAQSLRAQAEKLRATHPQKSVDYEVVVKDGKTTLKPVLK